jgi:hypothetical protein
VVVVRTVGGQKTCDWFREPRTYPLARLSRVLGIDIEPLQDFIGRNILVQTALAAESQAFKALERVYFRDEASLVATGEPRNIRRDNIARRKLQMPAPDKEGALQLADGMRCETLSEAYPKVIQFFRSLDSSTHMDHMGRRFREALGFKLVLQNPLKDCIPGYWLTDEAELQKYFDQQFLDNSGLFGRRFRAWGNDVDQIGRAVSGTVEAIEHKIATRRIGLWIAEPTRDVASSLGLVSVHVIPRQEGDQWLVHFYWLWRTVESLVGLPFSAYGSIRQSAALLTMVNNELTSRNRPPASMGNLTYYAISLHMFADEGDEDIARAVVVDAIY